jgi:hypothetical protein
VDKRARIGVSARNLSFNWSGGEGFRKSGWILLASTWRVLPTIGAALMRQGIGEAGQA